MFDRDELTILKDVEKDQQNFKSYGNNVFAFCIPSPLGKEEYENISIEFYYYDEFLKKKIDGKCLYFDNELNFDNKRQVKSFIDSPAESFAKKIHDENIGGLSWIHSKGRFAELVESDVEFTEGVDFLNFNLIFEKIRKIISE